MSSNGLVFFDLDGPILDVVERHHKVYADSVVELGGKPISRDEYWAAKRRKTPERDILQSSGVADRAEAFNRLKLARIEAAEYLVLDSIVPGILPVLSELSKTQRLVLVTLRNSRTLLEWQLEKLGLSSWFDPVLSGRESKVEGWRIKSDLIRGAFSELHSTDWIIGDTETDVLAGQHLGLRTAAVCNGIRCEELLRTLKPDRLLPTAADFGFS